MTSHGYCPQCNTEISSERYGTGYAICECGWCDSAPVEQAKKKSEKHTMMILGGAAIAILALYMHLLSWGTYAVSIPFTKVAQITGMLSKSGYEDLAKACVELNKWSCAKDAYVGLYRSTGDASGIAALAYLQTRLNEPDAALSTYASYVKVGGNDGLALLRYAKMLEERGQNEQAFQIYEKSIAARSEILPVQATTAVVRLLMKQGKYEDAYNRILAFHESAGNAKGYLNTELAQLEEALGLNKAAKNQKDQPRKGASKKVASR